MRAIWTAMAIGILLLASIGADAPTTTPTLKDAITIDLAPGVSIDFVLIHPGSFSMGSTKGEDDEKPPHKVTISKPFYLGKFTITQQQWQAVMGENPSEFKGEKNPVDNISWDDCQEFLQKLAEKLPNQSFALPTEAQWEYACRAGSTTKYFFGDDAARLPDYAWYSANSSDMTHPVGAKKPNAWGLFDMQGNVCQWCGDFYASSYPSGDATDPTGPATGDLRVIRGESWVGIAEDLRPSYRVGTPPDYHNSHVGLRLVYVPATAE